MAQQEEEFPILYFLDYTHSPKTIIVSIFLWSTITILSVSLKTNFCKKWFQDAAELALAQAIHVGDRCEVTVLNSLPKRGLVSYLGLSEKFHSTVGFRKPPICLSGYRITKWLVIRALWADNELDRCRGGRLTNLKWITGRRITKLILFWQPVNGAPC